MESTAQKENATGFDYWTLKLSLAIAGRLLEKIHFSDDAKEIRNDSNRIWLEQRSEQLAPLVAEILNPVIIYLRQERIDYRNKIITLLGGDPDKDNSLELVRDLARKCSQEQAR